jgi:RNA polymerase sigma factor (sigma-70 family)
VTTFVPRSITEGLAGRGRWWVDDYLWTRGAIPDGRLPWLFPVVEGERQRQKPRRRCPRTVFQQHLVLIDGFCAGAVVFQGNELIAVSRIGRVLRRFHLSLSEGCAPSKHAALMKEIDKYFPHARMVVEEHFAELRSFRDEYGDPLYIPKHVPTVLGRARVTTSIEVDDDEEEAKKQKPGLRKIDETAFVHSGNHRLLEDDGDTTPTTDALIEGSAPEEMDADDSVEVTRGRAQPEEAAVIAASAAGQRDNDTRWRPATTVIAGRWTSPSSRKTIPKAQPVYNLSANEEARLFDTLRVCRDDPEKTLDYNQACTAIVRAYESYILERVKFHCKTWANLSAKEVCSWVISHLFKYKKLNYYNPNRAKFKAFLRSTIKTAFADYLRELRKSGMTYVPKGTRVDVASIGEAIDSGDDGDSLELGEVLDAVDYRHGNSTAHLAVDAAYILTPQEYQVFAGVAFDGKSREELSEEMDVSPQRISELRLIVESKIKDYRRASTSEVEECA